MKRKIKIILGIAVLLLLLLGCWRLFPRSAEQILSIREDETTRAAFTVIEFGVADNAAQNDVYTINTVRPTDAVYQEMAEILDSTTYTPSLWNLTGLTQAAFGNEMQNLNELFVAQYVWGTQADYVTIQMYKNGEDVILTVNDRVYYPKDPAVLERLMQAIKNAHEVK